MMIRQSIQHSFTPTTLPYLISGTLLATSALAVKKVQNVLSKRSIRKQRKFKSEKDISAFLQARRLMPF